MALFSDIHRAWLANLLIGLLVLDLLLFVVEEIFLAGTGPAFTWALQFYYLVMILPLMVMVMVWIALIKPEDSGWRTLAEFLAALLIVMQLISYGEMLMVLLRARFHF